MKVLSCLSVFRHRALSLGWCMLQLQCAACAAMRRYEPQNLEIHVAFYAKTQLIRLIWVRLSAEGVSLQHQR